MAIESILPDQMVVGFLNVQSDWGVTSQASRLNTIASALRENLSDAVLIGVCEIEGKETGHRLAEKLGLDSVWVSNDRDGEYLGIMGRELTDTYSVALEPSGRFNACMATFDDTTVAVAHLLYRPIGGGPRRRQQITTLMQDERFAAAEHKLLMCDTNHPAWLPLRRRHFARFGFTSVFTQLDLRHYPTVATPATRPHLRPYERVAMTLSRHPGFSVDDIYTNGGIRALEFSTFTTASDHLGLRTRLQRVGQTALLSHTG